MPRHAFSVAASAQGTRLDRFLAQSLPAEIDLSRTSLVRLIEQGAVEVDRKPATTRALPLRAGQEVSLNVADKACPTACTTGESTSSDPDITTTRTPLEVLYEDEHLLCFVKPAGLTTHPAPSMRGETLVDRLKAHCAPRLAGYPQDPRCGIVHRLDKDTSGVMVAAKTEQTRLALSAMFARHDLQRRYLALVWGVPARRQGTIDAALARHPVQRTRMAVRRDSRQGKGRHAVTHYKVKEVFKIKDTFVKNFDDAASLLVCRLETGRTHQIRAHLSSIGHAVIGDPLYADPNPCLRRRAYAESLPVLSRQALHAEGLEFTHPIDAQVLSFSASPPRDFQALLEALRDGQGRQGESSRV